MSSAVGTLQGTVVRAAPGSGKTTRVARDVLQALVRSPESVHAVTFTNEAAREMASRIDDPAARVSTIHSLAYYIISGSFEAETRSSFYNDMLVEALRKVEAGGFEASFLAIDEAQDISAREYAFLLALARRSDRVLVVGDPMQSIFGFQGGEPRFMQNFEMEGLEAEALSLTRRFGDRIAGFVNETFALEHPIHSERAGGVFKLHLAEPASWLEQFVERASPARALNGGSVGVLLRTNWEVVNCLKCLKEDWRSVNAVIPMQSHPLVAIIGTILGAERGIDLQILRTCVDQLGYASYGSWQALEALRSLQKTGIEVTVENLRALAETARANMFLTPAARKALRLIVEIVEYLMTKRMPGQDPYELLEAVRREGFRIDPFWTEDNSVIVEAALCMLESGRAAYHRMDNGSGTTFMTIHAAKGKEFDHVLTAVSPAKSIDIYDPEEERVMYVACTRARESLDVVVPLAGPVDRTRRNVPLLFSKAIGVI